MVEPSQISRETFDEHTVHFYRSAGGTRPDLRAVDIEGERVVVKDFRGSDALFRQIVGPILIRREFGALCKLNGVEGVPRPIAKLDRYAFAMEDVRGVNLCEVEPGALDNEFYARLMRIVEDVHERGVAHCDLRNRGNVVRGQDGRPYLVDFAACVFRGRGINPFISWLFRQFANADRNAVLRIKRRLSPELLTESEESELQTPLPFERPAQFIKRNVRRLTRLLFTGRSA